MKIFAKIVLCSPLTYSAFRFWGRRERKPDVKECVEVMSSDFSWQIEPDVGFSDK